MIQFVLVVYFFATFLPTEMDMDSSSTKVLPRVETAPAKLVGSHK
jgi:hypothetical protein